MRVFVTGGTGAIGGYAVPALIRAGHTVSALARSSAKAIGLHDQGATPVTVSLFDRSGLTAAFADHDAIINLASALPSTTAFLRYSAWKENERVRTEGSAAVVDAARDAGVPQLIQESIVMIYAEGGDDWIDEHHPVDHFPIARGNHAAEASARRFVAAGGRATVLRFGVFYGRGAAHSEQILAMARTTSASFPVAAAPTYRRSISQTPPPAWLQLWLRPAGHTTSSTTSHSPSANTPAPAPTQSASRPGSVLQAGSRCSSVTARPH